MPVIRISQDNYDLIKILAKEEKRSSANMLNRIVELAVFDWDRLSAQEREDKLGVKKYIVEEGRALGILPTAPGPI